MPMLSMRRGHLDALCLWNGWRLGISPCRRLAPPLSRRYRFRRRASGPVAMNQLENLCREQHRILRLCLQSRAGSQWPLLLPHKPKTHAALFQQRRHAPQIPVLQRRTHVRPILAPQRRTHVPQIHAVPKAIPVQRILAARNGRKNQTDPTPATAGLAPGPAVTN
jgi:hypothetical protein